MHITWESRHDNTLKGKIMQRQKRSDIPWPDVLHDFEGWTPKKRRGRAKKGLMGKRGT